MVLGKSLSESGPQGKGSCNTGNLQLRDCQMLLKTLLVLSSAPLQDSWAKSLSSPAYVTSRAS